MLRQGKKPDNRVTLDPAIAELKDLVEKIYTEFFDFEIDKLKLLFPDTRVYSVEVNIHSLNFTTLPQNFINKLPDFCIADNPDDFKTLWKKVVLEAEKHGYIFNEYPPYILSFTKIF